MQKATGSTRATKIYLLRHGETQWNVERRIQGHRDSRLTERGRAQALANGERLRAVLAGQAVPPCISSPLGRCRETARLVCGAIGIEADRICFDDRLREHAYGDWEGRTMAEIAAADAEHFRAREADKWGVPAPQGESYALVETRLRSWLTDIEGRTVIVVSHGCAGRILRGIYAGLPRADVESLADAHDQIHILNGGSIETLSVC